jgi:hypothetical protein
MNGMDDLIAFVRLQWDIAEADADAILIPPPGYYDKGWQADKLREFATRMLDDIEAKRAILDWALTWLERDCAPWNADLIRMLAQPYAGREGWREEWRS